jgi:hypothetical protein
MGIDTNPWGLRNMTRRRTIFDLEEKAEEAAGALDIPKKRLGRKPGRIKTLTTKKRKVEIVFPTEEDKAKVFKKAEQLDIPVSKFILACVQEKMDVAGPSSKEVRRAQNRIVMLEAEIEALTQEKARQTVLIERLTNDLALWRTREGPIAETEVEDRAEVINQHLVVLLKERREVKGIDIIEFLKIDHNDRKACAALWRDIEALKVAELVEPTAEGFRWLGK